ncbi:MAG: sugar transporter ATP-binding protein [Microvirga sp.]|nr:sugar transporter ATP-binding protein [Microvirga sp.]
MRAEIKALHQRLKTTTIYVTHDQIEAMTMADKIVVMHDGVVEQIGAPLDLYDRPNNLFVAGFIGSPAMNLLAGHVTPAGFDIGGVVLPLGRAPAAHHGRRAYYGVRPEHFHLSGGGVSATIRVVEPTGSETQVTATLGGHEILCVFRDRIAARPGEAIYIRPNSGLVHVFDKETGRRLV